jgi:hypothetical protein
MHEPGLAFYKSLTIYLLHLYKLPPRISDLGVWNDRTGRPVGVVSGGLGLGKARPEGSIFVAPLRPLPGMNGLCQEGLLKALSNVIGPLTVNVP